MPTLPNVQDLGSRPVGQPRQLVLPPRAPSIEEAQSQAATPGRIGNALNQQAERIFTREDAVARVKSRAAYDEYAAETLRSFEVERDLSDSNTVKEYGQLLAQKQQEILSSHRGSPESRADLAMRLEDTRSRYSGEIAGRSLRTQIEIADQYMEKTKSEISSMVYDGQLSYDDAAAAWENEVKQMSGLYPQAYEGALRVGGKAEIASTQIQGMLDRGNYAGAEEFMLRDDIASVMSPEQQRRIRSRITIQQMEEDKQNQALMRQQRAYEAFLGRPMTQGEKTRMLGIDAPAGPKSLAQRIAEAEAVIGPLDDNQIEALYLADLGFAESGVAMGEGPFGNSIGGRSLNIMADLAPGYAAGILDPDQERVFQAALIEYTQPRTVIDPDTGLRTETRPELPPFVVQALEQSGKPVGELGAPVQPAATQELSDALGVGSGETVYQTADRYTGIVPAFGRFISSIPIIGDLTADQTEQFNSVVRDTKFNFNIAAKAIRENPRFAEAERQDILRDLDIDPAAWDTPSRFKSALQGIDDNLAFREQIARDLASSDRISREERQKAMDTLAILVPLRQKLGVPRRVSSPAEVAALLRTGQVKPGQLVRTPQGDIFEVPAEVILPDAGAQGGE